MSAREQINNWIQRMESEYKMNACMQELVEAGFFPVHDSFTVTADREEEVEKIVSKYFPRVDRGVGTVLR